MNTDNAHRAANVRSEAEELLATADWDLPPDRHLHHKEVLMRRIDQDRAAARPFPAPERRRLPRPAMVLSVAAALAGVLVVTVSGGGHGSAAAGGSAGRDGASVTLDRIAAAAMAQDATPIRNGQFVYVESLVRENTGRLGGPVRLGALHEQEVWTLQSRGPVTTTGWMRETGKDAVMTGEDLPITSTEPVRAGIGYPTYRWLASLPTDPRALRALLYARTRAAAGETADEAVFGMIGDLLSSTITPPATASALYKVAERIPGVTVVPDAVDAAGRHGIGVTRKDPGSATRDEWIFDKDTLAYLGSRSYLTRNKARGIMADTLYGIDAVMRHAVVDRHGEEPTRTGG